MTCAVFSRLQISKTPDMLSEKLEKTDGPSMHYIISKGSVRQCCHLMAQQCPVVFTLKTVLPPDGTTLSYGVHCRPFHYMFFTPLYGVRNTGCPQY
jgi:hypothetical protein